MFFGFFLIKLIIIQPLHYGQDVTQGQFSSQVNLIWIFHLLDFLSNQD